MVRKPFLFFFVFSACFCGSFSSHAIAGDARWLTLAPSEQALVDRVAADIYEAAITRPDARALETQTSQQYATGAPVDRARFREFRRDAWRTMDQSQQAALKSAKKPRYENLSNAQRAHFRREAMDSLGLETSAIAHRRLPAKRI